MKKLLKGMWVVKFLVSFIELFARGSNSEEHVFCLAFSTLFVSFLVLYFEQNDNQRTKFISVVTTFQMLLYNL
jgi:hypothetical protein